MSVSMLPHSGVAGSCGPRPRKLSPAASMIAVASASVPCTITGEMAFGSTCEMRIVRRRTPTARAASTKSFSRWASTDPRNRRAKIGTFTTPIAIITCSSPGPSSATMPIAIRKPGDREHDVDEPHQHAVDPAAEEAGDGPDERAERQADRHRDDADQQRQAGAVEDPRQLVAPEVVDAEQVVQRRAGTAALVDQRQVLDARVVRREERGEERDEDEEGDQHEADDRARIAPQPPQARPTTGRPGRRSRRPAATRARRPTRRYFPPSRMRGLMRA